MKWMALAIAVLAQVRQHHQLRRGVAITEGIAQQVSRLHVAQVIPAVRIEVLSKQVEVVVGLDEHEVGAGEMRPDLLVRGNRLIGEDGGLGQERAHGPANSGRGARPIAAGPSSAR